MKLKEIILDFTPLLDVVMIILFWFILNYHNQTVKIQEEAKNTMSEAQSISDNAYERQEELDELEKELLEKQDDIDELLNEIKEVDERKGANIEGLYEFEKGLNLTAKLIKSENGQFKIQIYKGNEINDDSSCEEMFFEDFTSIKLNEIIKKYGYDLDDAVLFELIYNNEESGSYRIIRDMDNIIDESKKTYKYLYSRKLKIK